MLDGKLLVRVIGEDGTILSIPNPYNLVQVLELKTGSQLEMFFSQPVTTIEMKLSTKSDFVKISYFKRKQKMVSNVPVVSSSSTPVYEFELIKEDTILLKDLKIPVIYNDIDKPVDKAVILAGPCTPGALVCDTQITAIGTLLETFLNDLAQNNDISKPTVNLSSNPDYQTSFCNTALYTGDSISCNVTYSTVKSTTTLNATLDDGGTFLAHFTLQLKTPSSIFDWTKVVGLHNLQHDPIHVAAGPHYDFEITADVQINPTTIIPIVLTGTSDSWPIIFCHIRNYLLEEQGGYLLQEDTGRIILDDDGSAECSTVVYEICWLTLFEQLSNDNAPNLNAVQSSNQAMIDGINLTVHPVWRPNTMFAIQVETQDKLSTLGTPYQRFHTFGFKTTGTIGHWHETKQEFIDLESQDREEQFKLSSLKHYIDYSKSYPNADGDLLNAKPIFFKNPILRIFYVKDYVYSMLNDWGVYNGNDGVNIDFETLIKDPITPVTPAFTLDFEKNTIPVVQENTSLLNNILDNSIPCTNILGPIQPVGVNTTIQVPDNYLKPLKLYNAIFNVKTKLFNQPLSSFKTREVHRYNFQTSRYATFKDQIESYILSSDLNNPKFAIFRIERAFDAADIAKAGQVINNTLPTNDVLIGQFAEKFDRLFDGALKLGSLAAAVTTEFNIIKNTNTGNILGVLIRNPEPFNDPKLPDSVFVDALSLTFGGPPQNGGSYDVIWSKDKAKAFVTNSALSTGGGNAFFVFKYFEFDGSNYTAMDTQTVQFNIS